MSGVLVDTSVWTDHFRYRNVTPEFLLQQDQVLIHPLVIGEIACGTPPSPRSQTLSDLGLLTMTRQASMRETLAFIERAALDGTGCGTVDIVLLASTLMTPGALWWTLDKRLAELAGRFGVLHRTM